MATKSDRKMVSIAIVVVVLIVAATAGAIYFMRQEAPKALPPPLTPDQKVSQILGDVSRSEDESASKNAQQKLSKLAQQEPDVTKKTVYLSAAADLYFNSNDYAEGVKVSEQIDSLAPTAESAGSIAHGYMEMKDYKNAAKYFGLAADRSDKPASSSERAPYNDYMLLKQEAEARL